MSETINELVRRGLLQGELRRHVRLETVELGLRFDIANVAEALEIAEGDDRP